MRLPIIFLIALMLIGVSQGASGWYPGPGGVSNANVANFTIGSAGVGPEPSDDDQLLTAGTATNSTAWQNYTTSNFTAQPDYARGILLTPSKSTDGTVIVVGTDIKGNAITETQTWSASSAAKTTTYAFKSVSKVAFRAFTSATTFKVGTSDNLGLPTKLPCNTVLMVDLSGVREVNAPTVVTSASTLAGNTIDLIGTYVTSKPISVYYLV